MLYQIHWYISVHLELWGSLFFSFSFPGLIPLMLSPDWMTDSATVSEETESVTDWGTDSETDSWALEAQWIDHC